MVPARPLSRRRSCRGLPAWRPPGAAFLRPSGARCVCPGGFGRLAGVAALGGPGLAGVGPAQLRRRFPRRSRGGAGFWGPLVRLLGLPALCPSPPSGAALRGPRGPYKRQNPPSALHQGERNRTIVLFFLKIFMLIFNRLRSRAFFFFSREKKEPKKRALIPLAVGAEGRGRCARPWCPVWREDSQPSRSGSIFFARRGTVDGQKKSPPYP